MRTLIRIYSACCLIVVGFFVFFSIPWGLLPFSDAVDVLVVGGFVTSIASAVLIYLARGGGFEFGHFLAHGGLWVIAAIVFGLLTLLCGALLFVAPDLFVPAFEQGALPIGMLIVSMFWIALIFLIGFLAFTTLSAAMTPLRKLDFKGSLFGLAIGSFCLFLTGVFFSLYLDVINDNLFRMSEGSRWNGALVFAGLIGASALIYGFLDNKPERKGRS